MSLAEPDSLGVRLTEMITANVPFLQSAEGEMQFFNSVGFQNPRYASLQSLGNQNVLASNTAINFLTANNDARIDAFYNVATTGPNAGAHAGINQGEGKLETFPSDAAPDDFSQPGDAVAGSAAPVTIISISETYFLLAEAVVRGFITGDAQAYYEAGITASFQRWQIDSPEVYFAQPSIAFPAAGSIDDKLKAILTQKWISMCNTQSIEAWNEWRRTGYPDFFTVSATSLIGNVFPQRLPYPNSEIQTNPNTPAQLPITSKVWWDVN
jgi:hypothetical protein